MDLGQLADRLERAADRVGPAVERTVHGQARLLRALIMENASGRPGPNVITDKYRPSWKAVPFSVPDGGGSEVGTRKPQGKRLEYGFVGADSLGRIYNQPPFPHVEPAVNELSSQYEQAFRSALDDIFGSG